MRINDIFDSSNRKFKVFCFTVIAILLGIIFFCSRSFAAAKAEVIIGGCVGIVALLLFLCFSFFKIQKHVFSFVFIVLIGGMLVFIQPILNVPDESAHLARSELVSRGVFFINPELQRFKTIESICELKKETGHIYTQSDVRDKEIDFSSAEVVHVAASNVSVFYIPQATGILLAKLFGMKEIWLLWAARISNLLFYALVVSLAIKIAPKMQMIIFFVAALPISIQQASSCSPDASINGIAFLAFACYIYMYCAKKNSISIKNELLFWGLGILTTLAKVTNIFGVGLILLVPNNNFKNKKRAYIIKSSIIISVCVIGGLYYLYTTNFAPNLEQLDYLKETGVNATKQLEYIKNNFVMWIRNFGESMIYQSNEYIRMFNIFGPFTYGYEILTPVSIFMFAKICCQENGIELKIYQKVLVFLMTFGIFFTTCFAMYLSWTGVGSTGIAGVQGRYFVPLLILASVLFTTEKACATEKNHIVDLTVIILMLSAMLISLGVYYY